MKKVSKAFCFLNLFTNQCDPCCLVWISQTSRVGPSTFWHPHWRAPHSSPRLPCIQTLVLLLCIIFQSLNFNPIYPITNNYDDVWFELPTIPQFEFTYPFNPTFAFELGSYLAVLFCTFCMMHLIRAFKYLMSRLFLCYLLRIFRATTASH